MSNGITESVIIPTLLISLCTNAQALSTDTITSQPLSQNKTSPMETNHIKTETVQLLELQNDPGKLMINVAGEPGVHFQVHFSTTGEEGSYTLFDKAEAVIGNNSFASLTLDLKALKSDTVFLNLFSNDDGDFSKIGRKIIQPIPIVLKTEKMYIVNAQSNSNDNNATDNNDSMIIPKDGWASMGVRG